MSKPQSYANHRRYSPIFHFVASPLLAAYAAYSVIGLIREPSTTSVFQVVLAFGVWSLGLAARLMALRVQDRLIRLEMQLRLRSLLPVERHGEIHALRPGQMVALRFASDAELPDLVGRVGRGELVKSNDIKRAIQDWQPDHLRA